MSSIISSARVSKTISSFCNSIWSYASFWPLLHYFVQLVETANLRKAEYGHQTPCKHCNSTNVSVQENPVCCYSRHHEQVFNLYRLVLLYIHRRYFAGAIKLNRQEPMKCKYGASVLATIRSACLLLSSLRSLYGKYPEPASKQCYFWSGAFSACVCSLLHLVTFLC